MVVDRKCMRCGEIKSISVPDAGFQEWQAGELIQVAMPDVSAGDRQLLMSGICGECYDEMFPDENENGDEGSEEDSMSDG